MIIIWCVINGFREFIGRKTTDIYSPCYGLTFFVFGVVEGVVKVIGCLTVTDKIEAVPYARLVASRITHIDRSVAPALVLSNLKHRNLSKAGEIPAQTVEAVAENKFIHIEALEYNPFIYIGEVLTGEKV